MTEFEKDVVDLLSHTKGGHIQRWLYSDLERPDGSTGHRLWHEFVTAHKNYYTIRNEIALIPDLVKRLDNNFDSIVDFGIGNAMAINNKTLPIIQAQKNMLLYTAIDLSGDELRQGLRYLETKMKIKAAGINADFYTPHNVEGNKKLGLCLGGTITNQDMRVGDDMPVKQIVERIRTLGKTTLGTKESTLVLSFDTNPDLDNAQESYNHHAWKRMQTGFMYDIQKRLKPEGDFQPSMWHFEAVIDQDNYVLQQTACPSVDQSFLINGREFNVRKGDQFVMINLFKFPVDFAIDMVEKAGLKYKRPPVQSDDHPLVMLEAEVA